MSLFEEHLALEDAFSKYDCPTWEEDPTYRDAAIRWHLRGFAAGLEFARNEGRKNAY